MSEQGEGRQPTEEELNEALRVEQLVASTLQMLVAVGFGRLGEDPAMERDLDQVALAIETIRALLPVSERFLAPAGVTQLRGALSELQLAYVEARGGAPAAPPRQEPPQPPPRPRPTIWTPGGER